MSDPAIFALGSVVFIATSWATIAFGMARIGELEREERERDQRPAEFESSGADR